MSRLIKLIGNTPMVELAKISKVAGNNNKIFGKLEFNNPGGSLKDRAVLGMITAAEKTGKIKPGDTLVEPTSGNTGVSLAMLSALLGYRAKIVMSKNGSREIHDCIRSHGAELILVDGGNTKVRDTAADIANSGQGVMLNQFDNHDNWKIHYETTGPEIWNDTNGKVTHFVTTIGSMGTITGVSRYLKAQNPDIKIVAIQPDVETQRIPGISRWPAGYEPKIGELAMIDQIIDVSMPDAKKSCVKLSKSEGIFAGFTSGAALWGSLELAKSVSNAVIVFIICDRGERYLSMNIAKTPDQTNT